MRKKKFWLAAGWTPFALLIGCTLFAAQNQSEKSIPVSVLYNGSQCGEVQQNARIKWFDHPDRLRAILSPPMSSPGRLDWDPQTEGAVLILMGAKPTGGYRLAPAAASAPVKDGVATIVVNWQAPAPDQFVTQAFTSPCLLLKLPKADIRQVVILDQDGVARARLPVLPRSSGKTAQPSS